MENDKYNPTFSFKYNHTLLYKEYFINLATHNQHKSEANLGESTMFQFVINLKNKNKNCGRMGKKYISRIFKWNKGNIKVDEEIVWGKYCSGF